MVQLDAALAVKDTPSVELKIQRVGCHSRNQRAFHEEPLESANVRRRKLHARSCALSVRVFRASLHVCFVASYG